ncbi:uncharacterized protein LOC124942807 [Impatiens glandulifera]|uniref:uncharacterized protein LOC124942807 n=1 Tax=Impatiens glandulifera TaxID=253017 RepID=UPI001FB06395|nr:uncharacterized protein LOC124942807 [Impatiens glandulifera]
MGHRYLQEDRNPAVDGVANLFTKASHDLSLVHDKLEKEFIKIYPNDANPMKLVSRIKKVEEDLSTLKDQCRELLAAKQDLIDKARMTLVGNKLSVQRMQSSLNIPVANDNEDPAYANFNQVIDEWTARVKSKTGDKSDSEDLNQLLFSAIVNDN